MSARFLGSLLAGALLLFDTSAQADEELCPLGQVASRATAGHCCWPEQTWDSAQQLCSGKPICPARMSRDGLTCIAAAPAAATPPPPVDDDAPVIDTKPAPKRRPPAANAEPAVGDAEKAELRPLKKPATAKQTGGKVLFVTGIVSLGVGYLVAVISAGAGTALAGSDSAQYGGSCASGASLSFIPLIGPFLTLASYPRYQIVSYSNGSPYVLDCNGSRSAVSTLVWTDEVLQLGGAGMIVAGILLRRAPPVVQTNVGRIEFVPGAPMTPLGASIRLTDF
jgi:hypothetical protein